jgi:hypothetical protein
LPAAREGEPWDAQEQFLAEAARRRKKRAAAEAA